MPICENHTIYSMEKSIKIIQQQQQQKISGTKEVSHYYEG